MRLLITEGAAATTLPAWQQAERLTTPSHEESGQKLTACASLLLANVRGAHL